MLALYNKGTLEARTHEHACITRLNVAVSLERGAYGKAEKQLRMPDAAELATIALFIQLTRRATA